MPLQGCDALAIVTEWEEFRSPDFAALKQALKTPAIFDGRNLYDPAMVRALGFEYFPIGSEGLEGAATRGRRAILVVGDVMLDRYWFGDVSRISPEAPVPVVLFRDEEEQPGRRRQRRAQLRGARRADAAAVGDRRRRADGARSANCSRREGVAGELAPRRVASAPRGSCA